MQHLKQRIAKLEAALKNEKAPQLAGLLQSHQLQHPVCDCQDRGDDSADECKNLQKPWLLSHDRAFREPLGRGLCVHD